MVKLNKKRKRLLLNIVFVVILIAITLVVLFVSQKDDLDFDKIVEYFKSCNPAWIAGAFVCMILFLIFEGLSIYCIARFFGYKPNIVATTAYSCANAFYTAVTPTGAGGQPAEVFYMSRDGMSPGRASFAILLNTIGYSAAMFFIGIMAVAINPALFTGINAVFAQILVVAGAIIQLGLLGLFIGCMFFGKIIIKLGKGIINILCKIKLVKKKEKWYARIEEEVQKYGECRQILKEKPLVCFTTLIFNVLQRVSQTLIPCFVCLAVDPEAPFLEIFALQGYVLFGYNATPLPGGVGAYEYLFMNVFGQIYGDSSFILLVLMISRLFSYYLTFILSGIVTLTYHLIGAKKAIKKSEEKEEEEEVEEVSPELAEEVKDEEEGAN